MEDHEAQIPKQVEKLVSLHNKLLESFYMVTQQCSKINVLQSKVMPHAAVQKKINHKPKSLPG